MSDAKTLGEADPSVLVASGQVEAPIDVDPAETSEWLTHRADSSLFQIF
jgi:hypothetical protein